MSNADANKNINTDKKLENAINTIVSDKLYKITISKPLSANETKKISIRPVMIQGKLLFQETQFVGTKAVHDNFNKVTQVNRIIKYMKGEYGQLDGKAMDMELSVLTNKKGTMTIKSKKLKESNDASQAMKPVLTHNRTKQYILNDGEPVDFLIELGVMMPDGKVAKAKFDKFKQINRYLEFVRDIMPFLEGEETVRIVDFGCGKSYLTFALYYYLKIKNNKNVDIIGLDLKKDVIETCNRLKNKLHYDELRFLQGDIKDYENTDRIDMVVSLHACDTATDYALSKAIGWGAKVIMAVPCCHHELNKTISQKELADVLKYGIIKERVSALITDAYRANMLEQCGYDTQMLEFIDMEHTPKNILIRAVMGKGKAKNDFEVTDGLEQYLGAKLTLGKLLKAKE